ncbi:hypothetical protein H7A76_31290 [Pseudomonas sp. MSSRFD41]|uniref:pyocin knob domain-containing protein n=1 Tax=Pseudomonas sp. MSSRFD41 TaxID=1310370 RepID=UPI001639B976|nr:pyocin knob domain-containing protein [Pseudomonas sp. MSSRFD41]MBC2659936.1 hypothetical protein [Pseudomonas sp. MSSRFD41]
MARKNIELGVIPTGQGGDTFRSAMTKVNDMTGELYDKTAGSQPGATKNRPDAELLARANHTGAQPASTISDFSPAVKAVMQTVGLGANAAPRITDCNEARIQGCYRCDPGATNAPRSDAYGTLEVSVITPDSGSQVFTTTRGHPFGEKKWFRTFSGAGGIFSPWMEIVKAGDYGLGATSLLACNDANNVAASGDLLVHPGTLNGPNPGVYGTIKTTFYEKSSSNWTQLILSTTGNKMFYRGCINGGIQPWMQVNEESITNSNGTAVKFSDGTMICWKESSTIQTTSNQVSTGVFLGAAEIFTFPVPFVTIGVVIPSVSYSAYAYCWGSVGEGNNPNQCRVVGFSHAANAQYQARYLAVGRWR